MGLLRLQINAKILLVLHAKGGRAPDKRHRSCPFLG